MKRLSDLLKMNPGFLIEAHGNGHSMYFASCGNKRKKIKIPHALFEYAKNELNNLSIRMEYLSV